MTTARRAGLQAHRYAATRVVTALVTRRAAVSTPRYRTGSGGALAGVLLTALLLAGAAGYGAVRGSGADWRTAGAIVVERETGARYVVLDGRLHPVLNFASALLILGSGHPRVRTLPRRSLTGAPRGATLGIPGAPDGLPEPSRLLRGPWWVCSGPDPAGRPPHSALTMATAPAGGQPLAEGGLLVRGPRGPVQLVWHGHRFPIRNGRSVLPALGWAAARPVAVDAALLNVLPAGPDLDLPAVVGRGRPGAAGGTRVGEVFVLSTAGGARQFMVALADGYALISQVQADLLLGDPETVRVLGQRAARPLSAAEYAVAPRSSEDLGWGSGRPARTPALAPTADRPAVCASASDSTAAAVLLDGSVGSGTAPPAGARVDRVVLPAGGVALVGMVAVPGAPAGTLSVVTDQGVRYPVADRAALTALGYGEARPVPVPAAVLALLPVGRTLDRAAAAAPAPLAR